MTPKYGAAELTEQKRAVYDAGYDGWVLWSPGSVYEPFLSALEKKEVSRKKPFVSGAKPLAKVADAPAPAVAPAPTTTPK
jgi:hypothetical protein